MEDCCGRVWGLGPCEGSVALGVGWRQIGGAGNSKIENRKAKSFTQSSQRALSTLRTKEKRRHSEEWRSRVAGIIARVCGVW